MASWRNNQNVASEIVEAALMSVADSYFSVELKNPCIEQKDHCLNCHSHFMAVRPHIKSIVVTKRFFKDLRDEEKAKAIVRDVLDCSNSDFYELHKFEKHVNGCMVFRAKTEGMHIVYCVDKNMRLIFMRVFKNFKEYEKFLYDKKEISKLIMHT
jgi:mRNA-degrading endonuclease RelE of RelBE toxin-antitoxin system